MKPHGAIPGHTGERPGIALPLCLAVVPFAAVLCGFLLPYAAALSMGLRGGGITALSNPALKSIAFFTLRQALWSVLCAVALGLPGAWIIGSGNFRSSSFLRALTTIPFAMPSILVVLGFVLFFGNAGWANTAAMRITGANSGPFRILYRPSAIVLAHGFYNFPIVIRLVGTSIAQAKKSYAPPAASLGASGLVTALTILFPLAFPSLIAASLLIFLYSFTSFAVVLVLGGGPAGTTLAVEIYRYARIFLDLPNAGALALLETAIAGTAFLLYLLFEWKSASQNLLAKPMEKGSISLGGLCLGGVYLLTLFVLVIGPLLSIPLESFLYRPSRAALPQASLRWWRALGGGIGGMRPTGILPALGRSLILAFLSATVACLLGILSAGARYLSGPRTAIGYLIRIVATAPLVSSGIVLGLGWIALYGRTRARALPAVVMLHGIAALPFAFNAIYEGFREIPPTMVHAAAVFGAAPLRRLITLELPLLGSRIASAWGFAAALSLGELNAILILGMEDWETLPLFIYRAVSAYRYGIACAAGTLLTGCCLAALLLSERTGGTHGH